MSGGDPASVAAFDAVFVGRAAELATLDAAVDAAAGRQGRAVFVGGEPGIGKTSLAEQVTARARQRGFAVSMCRCRDHEPAPPYWPWIDLVRVAGHDPTQAPLAALLLGRPCDALEGAGAPPPESRLVLFDRFATGLLERAHDRPLLLVFDDLHGADRSSLSLLQLVVQRIAAEPVLVLGLHRDVDPGQQAPLSAFLAEIVRQPGTLRMSLGGLDADDVQRLVEAMAGAPPRAAVVQSLLRQSGGNPFFLKELVRLVLTGHTFDVCGDAGVAIPQSVRDVISQRLDGLSADCARMLRLAAVIGPEFGLPVLERLAGLARPNLLGLLDEAARARLVAATRPSSGRYAFSHGLFRETLYAELPATQRVGLHRRAGEILEELAGSSLDDRLPELAFHFAQAAPDGDVAKAVAYALRAGQQADAATAYEEAARSYESALDLLELAPNRDEHARCDALLFLGEARWREGAFQRARSTALRAFQSARAIRSPDRLARAALQVSGRTLVFAGAPDREAVAVLEEALLAVGDKRPGLTALLSGQLARELVLAESPERLHALAEGAIRAARCTGDPRILASVLRSTYWPLFSLRRLEERLLVAREITALGDALGDTALAVEGRAFAFLGHLEAGDRPAAVAELEAATRAADRLRQPDLLWLVTLIRGCWASGQGAVDEFARLSEEALRLGRDVENSGAAFFFGFQSCFLALLRGRFAEAEQLVLSQAGTFPLVIDSYRALLAVIYAVTGRSAEARAELDHFAARGLENLRHDILWTGVVVNLANACALLGDASRAGELYALLTPQAGQLIAPLVVSLGPVDRHLGQLAATMGHWDAAERHFEDAVALSTRMQQWLPLAFTQVDRVRMLIARGARDDPAKIEALLAETSTLLDRLGVRSLLAGVQVTDAATTDVETRTVPSLGLAATVDECALRKEGEFWSIVFRGEVARLRHRKGLEYLAHLLRSPERHFAALDLAIEAGDDLAGAVAREGVGGARRATRLGDAGPVLDRTARDEYRRRRAEIEADLAEAERMNEPLRAARLREESGQLARELALAIGIGGRARRSGSAAERSRSTVTKGIRGAIRAIAGAQPTLGRYLDTHVRTGHVCVYVPDVRHPIAFTV